MTEKTVKEILLEAADLGQEHGVCADEFHNTKTGSMCINGLIGAAIKGRPLYSCAEYDLMMESPKFQEVIAEVGPVAMPGKQPTWGELAHWNNTLPDKERQARVLDVLSRAAISLF